MSERKPVSTIPPFGLRLQPALKTRLEESASANNRSLNAEISQRLQESIDGVAGAPAREGMTAVSIQLPTDVFEQIDSQAKFFKHTIDDEIASRLASTRLTDFVRTVNNLSHTLELERARRKREVGAVFDSLKSIVESFEDALAQHAEEIIGTAAAEELQYLVSESVRRVADIDAYIDRNDADLTADKEL
ncbi:Arc family DNA-binding protein [Burkholderia gladioli]|uniref:Arc family DNA-binding protein n=1 Tax=Burkholderia gladioli TaxID=28095 RepID=UPI001641DBC0|nr:Arc family DNA-binding protein [Burkholderia gladioli]